MAEGVLLPLAGNVLELLSVVQASDLAVGNRNQIEDLIDRVSKIQAVILDAEKKSSHDYGIQDWLRKLKNVLFDADDILDLPTVVLRRKLMTGKTKTKQVRVFFPNPIQLSLSRKMGRKLKAIRKGLTVVEKDRPAFDFSRSYVEPQGMIRDMETYYFVLEDEVIGRENDKQEIIERLFDYNVEDNISIIPIVGIEGMGKTTLAQLVYNDQRVYHHFDLKCWIFVSRFFDVKRIVKEILEQLTKRKHEESLEILQNRLREELNGKKYLIVLDGMFNEDNDTWLLLINPFMGSARGSRIIVTTRFESVERLTGATSMHVLKGLSEEEAWSLFVKIAFKQGQPPEDPAFIEMGKQILEKCDGVPLIIRRIANLLCTKASKLEWRCFINNELSKIRPGLDHYMLRYDDLPSHLKQCFAYCALFPPGYKFHIETLINLWAAQGFIKLSNSKKGVEDVGREYFMELLQRSFFQDVEKDKLGNIGCCKMHGLMHNIATTVAGEESAGFFSTTEAGAKVRHLSIYPDNFVRQLPILEGGGMRLRTVLVASVGGQLPRSLTCDALLSHLNYIRTLDLSELKLYEVPHLIGELKHLRYLDLSKNEDIKFLPNSITKLLNLQTLKLNDCYSLKELPHRIKKLVNLRHLDIAGCLELTHMPLGLGYLTSLEILTMFVMRQGVKVSSFGCYKEKQPRFGGGLSELKELSNLGGSLLIKYLGHGEDEILECKATNMKEKQHLQGLQLLWEENLGWDGEIECHDENSLEGLQPHPNLKALGLTCYMGMKIPSWVSSLTNLVDLGLYKNRRLQHLPPLNQLPSLKFVFLIEIEALEYISKDSFGEVFSSSSETGFFRSLHSLRIEKCPNLKGWWRNSDDDVNEPDHLLLPSFPRLFELQIVECPNLTSMPLFPHLKEILKLHGSSSKVLLQTMKMAATTSSSSYYFPLSQLEVLSLDEIPDLEFLPEEGLQNLNSLRTLNITKCLGFKSLPWIGNLTSLQRLFIRECPNLTSLPQGICDLKSLQHLAITGCPILRQKYQRRTVEDWLKIADGLHLDVDWNQQEIISSGPVPSSSVIKKSKEISETEESGECEEETDADIETTLTAKGITPEQHESNEEDPSPSLFLEDNSSLPTQGAGGSSLPMSQTPNSRNEADVLTNTRSNQDGAQDLSLQNAHCPTQGPVPSSSVIKKSKEISETEESGECEEETDLDIETTLTAKGITPEQHESNEEDPSPSLFSEDNSSLPTQGAGGSSLPMSQTPNSRNEADVLTNTWSNQDGAQDLSLQNAHCPTQGPVPSSSVIKKSKEISETEESGECEEETDADIETTLTAKGITPEQQQDLSFGSIKVSEISELMDLPTRVHSLKIEGCDDLEFIPEGVMSSELSLQDLYIINCRSLKSFPKDHPPTALKILYIMNCKKLNFPLTTEKKTHQDALLEYLCIGSSCDSLKFLSLDLFPNLKSLSIWDCANLESLSMPVQKNLTSLGALEIRDCPNLVTFLGGGLCTMNLTSIWLSNCKKLEKLPELNTLDSLQSMFINNCPELVSLSEKGLPSRLSLLSITFCNKLELKDEWGLDGLDYLRRLEIEGGCVDVGSFPEKFLPSNLSSLRISRLSNLKNLDNKGFQQLTALQRLEISYCPNLQSLPEDGFPSSLSFLCIKECPLLTSKFRNKKGKDWSKIDHISCIEIDEEVIS
ncbi:putative disease resistance protein RGA1 [Castanea sativa]|uniref:putative disease resistance protein RGA1 n=1 Tax=Castanea sativa TaxID=21020 RepID=UPI003F64A1AC